MARNDSRHMLPLSDQVFSKSTSGLDRRSNRQAYENSDFSYSPPHRPGTSYTAISSFSTPDLTATALPEYPQPDVPLVPHRFGGPAQIPITSTSPRRLVKSPPRSPAKSAMSGRGSGWRRFKVKVKKAFTFKRQTNRNSTTSDGRAPMVIGTPYGFQHVETHGAGPLRTIGPVAVPTTSGDGSSDVGTGHGWADVQSARHKNPSYGGARSRVQNTGGAAAPGTQGDSDKEGMVVEDDDDSAWEDYEATRMFTAHHGRH